MTMLYKQTIPTLLPMVLALAMVASPAAAADFAGASPVPDAQLAHLRGGFAVGDDRSQLRISFGIKRLSFINGELAAVTQLGTATGNGVHVIQNGEGNRVAAQLRNAVPAGSLATVIQNSLDAQTISNLNLYNINVTGMQAARTLAAHDSVVAALALAP